jgi:hypothetical protein
MDINTVLRSHQLERSEVLATLHAYLPRIIECFYDGTLPYPALSWERARRGTLGWYRPEDGLRLSFRINLNSNYAHRPLAEHLMALTYGLCHVWQHLSGKPIKHRYHHKAFRDKMAAIGLPCDKRGHILGVGEPFVSFLKELGVETNTSHFKGEKGERPSRSRSSLKAWRCHCTRVWAWREAEVDVLCFNCSHPFTPVERQSNVP